MPIPLFKNGSNKLRIVLYPSAFLLVAVLAWIGWGHQPEVDASQRLSTAEILVRSGAFEAARAEIESVLSEEPANLHGLLILGMLEERELHEARAIRAYEEARELTEDAELRRDIDLSLIDLERRMRRFDEARLRLASFELEHGFEAASERLAGLVDWESGNRELAMLRFEAARAFAPEDSELTLLLAGALIEDGRAADARGLLETVPETGARSSGSWKELARLYLESGDEESAYEALCRYAALDESAMKRLGQDDYWSSFKEHQLIGRLVGG